MAKRPVHWFEGMFLKPHHFQAAERYARERLLESEDWLHPHNWGLRSVKLDEDAIANKAFRLVSCQARFKDGTTLSVPEEASIDALDLEPILSQKTEPLIYLAIPSWQSNRSNAVRGLTDQNPRFLVNSLECPDENTGGDEEEIEFRNVRARLLAKSQLTEGFEVLPIARLNLAAPIRIDTSYVPPILGLDAWPSLQAEVSGLFRHIESWIDQESSQIRGAKIAFDSQVLGSAERILRLSVLNTATAVFQSTVISQGVDRQLIRGIHPLLMYQELCRLLGQLAIFGEARRPITIPGYDHDNIGLVYATVIAEIRRLLGELAQVPFDKRYFNLDGRHFQVHLEPDWTLDSTKIYVGVETTELTDAECDELMRYTDWKLGSGEQVETIFRNAEEGLRITPLNRIPQALPSGVVYFEIVRSPAYWKDVVRTRTLGLRFKLDRGRFLSSQMLALTSQTTGRTVNLQFAVFVVKGR